MVVFHKICWISDGDVMRVLKVWVNCSNTPLYFDYFIQYDVNLLLRVNSFRFHQDFRFHLEAKTSPSEQFSHFLEPKTYHVYLAK